MPATSVQQIFDALPARFQAAPGEGLHAVIQFDLTVEGGGQYAVTFAGRECAVQAAAAPNPAATLTATAADYLGMVNGELDPMQAFMRGRLQVRGDVSLLLKLLALFEA